MWKRRAQKMLLGIIMVVTLGSAVEPLTQDVSADLRPYGPTPATSASTDGLEWPLKGVVGILAFLSYQYIARTPEGRHMVRLTVPVDVECDADRVSVDYLAVALNQHQASLALLLNELLAHSHGVHAGGLCLAPTAALEQGRLRFELTLELLIDGLLGSEEAVQQVAREAARFAVGLYVEKVKAICEKSHEAGIFRVAEEVIGDQLKMIRAAVT